MKIVAYNPLGWNMLLVSTAFAHDERNNKKKKVVFFAL